LTIEITNISSFLLPACVCLVSFAEVVEIQM